MGPPVPHATTPTESNNYPTGNVKSSGLFILGTDTEVGKTYVACQIARLLAGRGIRVGAYKPALSGLADGVPSDAELLKEAAHLECSTQVICPQQFQAPLAPPLAARLEGRQVDDELLVLGANWWLGRCDLLIVEGAGGGLSPISDKQTVLDLAVAFGYPALLVAANRLGAVNHTLLTLEAAQRRNVRVAAVLLNRLPTTQDLSTDGNIELIRSFAPQVPCFELAQLDECVSLIV